LAVLQTWFIRSISQAIAPVTTTTAVTVKTTFSHNGIQPLPPGRAELIGGTAYRAF